VSEPPKEVTTAEGSQVTVRKSKKGKKKGPKVEIVDTAGGARVVTKKRSSSKSKGDKSNGFVATFETLMGLVETGAMQLRYSTRYAEMQWRIPEGSPVEGVAEWESIRRMNVLRGGGWVPMSGAFCRVVRMNLMLGDVSGPQVEDAVAAIAETRTTDDVVVWLRELPAWDGEKRIEKVFGGYFGARFGTGEVAEIDQVRLAKAVSWSWMVGTVARALRPGIAYDSMPILKGEQRVGKTTGIRILAGAYYESMQATLADKNAVRDIVQSGPWILEMEELAAIRKTDQNRTKAFITQTLDGFDVKYERHRAKVPRAFNCIGTTNEDVFLADMTGNVRYWVGEIPEGVTVDMDGLRRDREQLWAEALAAWDQIEAEEGTAGGVLSPQDERMADLGRRLRLEPDLLELLAGQAEERRMRTPLEGAVEQLSEYGVILTWKALENVLTRQRALGSMDGFAAGQLVEMLKKHGWRKLQVRLELRVKERSTQVRVRERAWFWGDGPVGVEADGSLTNKTSHGKLMDEGRRTVDLWAQKLWPG